MSIRLLRPLLVGVLIASVYGCGEDDDVAGPSGPSGPTQLTDDPESDFRPRWSPDGSRIAFVSYRSGEAEVWAQAVEGGDAVQITDGPFTTEPGTPRWSPNGDRIAFSALNEGIWIVPAGGGPAVPLTARGQGSQPRWSPDGTRIAFHSDRSGNLDVWFLELN